MRNIDWEFLFTSILMGIVVLIVIAVAVLLVVGMLQRFDATVTIINKWSEQSTSYIKSGEVNVPVSSTHYYFSTERGKFEYDPGASYVRFIEADAKVCITFNGLNYIIDVKGCN